MWKRNIVNEDFENKYKYKYNQIKRNNWRNFIEKLRNDYGKYYNKIIININKSL